MKKHVRILLGSESDAKSANIILNILKRVGVTYRVSIISCHRHAGVIFNGFIADIEESIIVFIGGMSLAAPGLIESFLRNTEVFNRIVFAIPTDNAARSAIEDLPMGTAIITSGLNEVSLTHSLSNSALAIAKLSMMINGDSTVTLRDYYRELGKSKPLIEKFILEDGLIPIKEKKIDTREEG